ncbi:lysozyme inhibitor LprI family protein [Serratia rubidaea]|uniref:lysozyme inhibitor LprI family protein n=1 Tax=Serratia rubidaea TaxID=61652 RepID=UPI001F23C7F4|nr:lysozyme inhibitor LprI family protein [Serratia rubidaea]
MMKVALLGVALLLTASQTAWAAQACGDKTSQTEMNVCAAGEYKQADAQLNARYKQLQSRLKGDEAAAKRLVAAQRAWIGFRDVDCQFSTGASEGGSLHGFVLSNCLTEKTQARSAEFDKLLNCPEGDTSCPVPPAP